MGKPKTEKNPKGAGYSLDLTAYPEPPKHTS